MTGLACETIGTEDGGRGIGVWEGCGGVGGVLRTVGYICICGGIADGGTVDGGRGDWRTTFGGWPFVAASVTPVGGGGTAGMIFGKCEVDDDDDAGVCACDA